MMKTLGERIRELREQQDLSLRELASKIGVSASFMSDVELNRRHPSDKHLSAIANIWALRWRTFSNTTPGLQCGTPQSSPL